MYAANGVRVEYFGGYRCNTAGNPGGTASASDVNIEIWQGTFRNMHATLPALPVCDVNVANTFNYRASDINYIQVGYYDGTTSDHLEFTAFEYDADVPDWDFCTTWTQVNSRMGAGTANLDVSCLVGSADNVGIFADVPANGGTPSRIVGYAIEFDVAP